MWNWMKRLFQRKPRTVMVVVGEVPGVWTTPAYVGRAASCKEAILMHARYWPYGNQTQEAFKEIRRYIAQRRAKRAECASAVEALTQDLALLIPLLPPEERHAELAKEVPWAGKKALVKAG